AKRLQEQLEVPIGIIHSSWGGTVAEAWTSTNTLKTLSDFEKILTDIKNPEAWKRTNEWYQSLDSIDLPGTNNTWNDLSLNDGMLANPDFEDEHWETMELPNRYDQFDNWQLDGTVWFRKEIKLTDAGSDYTLSAGVIDDMDATYFNGTKVGGLAGWGYHTAERIYTIPKELLKKGNNTIAIRAIDGGGPGTISGSLKLSNKQGVEIPLNGTWKYRPIAEIYQGKFYLYDLNDTDLSQRPDILQMGPNVPTVLYNAMIHPLVPYSIKGAIWYQGESNVGRAEQYARLFPKMINDWRIHWEEDFPFYYVQIAPFNYGISPDSENSAALRDAQRKSLATKNTGMVVTSDIGNFTNIHPGNKQDVGSRLAGLALANDYGYDLVASGPLYKSHTNAGSKILITFDHTGSGLMARDSKLNGFEIAGADKKFVPATAKIIDNTIELSSTAVANPVDARYAWSDQGASSLFNKEGLPASSFTTEN
ncbi:MAG: glycosyl hydrolase family 2, partial [Flavobacteriaceae bacterium]|nr:glycosyl hydrolase family 2 [Flavobacteriaceae bacterium]